tara:strand:- start:42 stop:1091 length:1050 start_codon:yes stop_codon:yes gene_type:complete
MEREIPRTLFSVSPYYQKFDTEDYEIILVQNGGKIIDENKLLPIAPNIRNLIPDEIRPSPCYAINFAASKAKAENLIICIDGARIWSNGILNSFSHHLKNEPNTILTVPAYHLGWNKQAISANEGYNQDVEDRMLEKVQWPKNKSSLYEISSPAGSNRGPNAIQAESNCLCIPINLFQEIGGYDEKLSLPGGGFCNPEFFKRVIESSNKIIQIETEGTFHQIHGGKSTNNEDPAAWVEKGRNEAIDKCDYNENYKNFINKNYYFIFESKDHKQYRHINTMSRARNFYQSELTSNDITFSAKFYIFKYIASMTNKLQNSVIGRNIRKNTRNILERMGLKKLVNFLVNKGI